MKHNQNETIVQDISLNEEQQQIIDKANEITMQGIMSGDKSYYRRALNFLLDNNDTFDDENMHNAGYQNPHFVTVLNLYRWLRDSKGELKYLDHCIAQHKTKYPSEEIDSLSYLNMRRHQLIAEIFREQGHEKAAEKEIRQVISTIRSRLNDKNIQELFDNFPSDSTSKYSPVNETDALLAFLFSNTAIIDQNEAYKEIELLNKKYPKSTVRNEFYKDMIMIQIESIEYKNSE